MDADILRYAKAMPQYQEPLNFLQCILDFQAALVERAEADLHVEPGVAQEKWQTGQPLFAGKLLSIPPAMFLEALNGLSALLPAGGATWTTLDQLLALDFMIPSNVKTLLDELMADTEACIRRLAEATSTDPDILVWLLRAVLSPFFQKQAMPYREWIKTAAWQRGICPICGSEPWLARLAHDNGRRILACPLCRTEWTFERLRCPFCEGNNRSIDTLRVRTQPRLRYFTIEGDEAHRIDCCDRCQRYLKTVDERVAGRPANLPVEDVITTHLDRLAREQGYL